MLVLTSDLGKVLDKTPTFWKVHVEVMNHYNENMYPKLLSDTEIQHVGSSHTQRFPESGSSEKQRENVTQGSKTDGLGQQKCHSKWNLLARVNWDPENQSRKKIDGQIWQNNHCDAKQRTSLYRYSDGHWYSMDVVNFCCYFDEFPLLVLRILMSM